MNKKVVFITLLITVAITTLITLLMIPENLGPRTAPRPVSLSEVPMLVWLHLATVLPAIPLGIYVLARPKGTARHKMLGRVWAGLMLTTATIALFLRDGEGNFSPIHIFSVVAWVSIPYAVWNIRRGNEHAHRHAMAGAFIGLLVAGAFALLPGRTIWGLLFA